MNFFAAALSTFNYIYTIALYIGMAVGLYYIAKNNNVPNPWIAFIPIVQYSIIGSICEEYIILGFRIKNLKWTLVILELLQVFLGFTFGFFYLPLRILVNILIVLVLHKFFYLFTPSNALIYAILSLLGRLPLVIIILLIKDKPMCMSAAAYSYPFAGRP